MINMPTPPTPDRSPLPELPHGGVIRLDLTRIEGALGDTLAHGSITAAMRDEALDMNTDAREILSYLSAGTRILGDLDRRGDLATGGALAHFLVRHGCDDYHPARRLHPMARLALVGALRHGQQIGPPGDDVGQVVAGLVPRLEAERDMHDYFLALGELRGESLPPLLLAGAGLVAVGVGYDILGRRLHPEQV